MYTYEMSPVATLIEIELLNKMSGLIGYENGGGTFVPGGSSGNFLAMLAARHYRMPAVMNSGLFGVSPMTIFVSKDCHYSMIKSANQLGIGTDNIIKVDVDKNPAVAQTYHIQGVPTLMLFQKGETKWRQSGVVQKRQLEQVINQFGS